SFALRCGLYPVCSRANTVRTRPVMSCRERRRWPLDANRRSFTGLGPKRNAGLRSEQARLRLFSYRHASDVGHVPAQVSVGERNDATGETEQLAGPGSPSPADVRRSVEG